MLSIEESERLGRRGLERGGKTIKQFMVGGRERFLETKRDECSGAVSLRPCADLFRGKNKSEQTGYDQRGRQSDGEVSWQGTRQVCQ